ncbi:MAG: glycoside hydrolase family protein [Flavobacteriales bacterium AspAUS03]
MRRQVSSTIKVQLIKNQFDALLSFTYNVRWEIYDAVLCLENPMKAIIKMHQTNSFDEINPKERF